MLLNFASSTSGAVEFNISFRCSNTLWRMWPNSADTHKDGHIESLQCRLKFLVSVIIYFVDKTQINYFDQNKESFHLETATNRNSEIHSDPSVTFRI